MSRTESLARSLLTAARWHRRLLASVAAAAGVYFGLVALSPTPPPTVTVLAAARDLPGGSTLAPSDLREQRLPPEAVPSGALRPGTDLTNRVLAAPVRAGEPLTDARFVGPALVRRSAAGLVAYPIRLDDAGIVALLRVGDRIDLYAAGSTASPMATQLATGAQVLALPSASGSAASGSGALVVVAVRPTAVARIAQAAVNSRITLALTSEPP